MSPPLLYAGLLALASLAVAGLYAARRFLGYLADETGLTPADFLEDDE